MVSIGEFKAKGFGFDWFTRMLFIIRQTTIFNIDFNMNA